MHALIPFLGPKTWLFTTTPSLETQYVGCHGMLSKFVEHLCPTTPGAASMHGDVINISISFTLGGIGYNNTYSAVTKSVGGIWSFWGELSAPSPVTLNLAIKQK